MSASPLRYVSVFIISGALLWLAVIAADLVPDKAIIDHVAPTLAAERNWEQVHLGTRTFVLDTFTECLGDSIGIFGSSNPIVRSLESRTVVDCNRARQDFKAAPRFDYWRYWHGYQIVSRPALALISPAKLRDLNQLMYVTTLLVLLTAASLHFGALPAIAAAAAGSLVPALSQFSLYTHSAVWILAFLGGTYIFLTNGASKHLSLGILFLVMGMLTSFFDLLSTPIVTLTIPLIAVCLLWRRQKRPVLQQLSLLVEYSAVWCCGYVGFWAAKWGLALLFVPGADFADLFNVISHRAGNAANEDFSGTVGRFAGVGFLMWQSRLACLLVGAIALAALSKAALTRELRFNPNLVPLLLVACAPFGWATVVLNHTVVHHWFVTPIVIPSLFIVAFLSLEELLATKREPFADAVAPVTQDV